MIFAGIERTSMVDWPGQICTTVFTAGCNFRCPFCHNPELVLPDRIKQLPPLESDDVLMLISERKNLIDGVCITGGEPLLHRDIEEFMVKVKALGLKVKLDTNGTNHAFLKSLLEKSLIDYVAMDIKAPLHNYAKAAGVVADFSDVAKSVRLIIASGVEHEFRTTVVRGMVSPEDIEKIALSIRGADAYYLQQFAFDRKMLDPAFESTRPYAPDELREMLKKVRSLFRRSGVRGV